MEAVLQLADRITDVVRDSLRAVILHGSLATGDFLAGRSDIDLLVVVTDLRHDRAPLLERLVLEADLGDAAGLDLHVVTAAVAARPERAPPVELHVGRYAEGAVIAAADAIEAAGQVAGADRHRACDGAGVAAGRAEITHRVSADPDMAVELAMARAGGSALHGPPPAEVIGEVPARWLRDRGRHWLTTWQGLTDDDEHAAHMVLTACRMWRFAAEGVHCGKVDAATWALGRDPSLAAVGPAVRRYITGGHDRIEPAAIGHLLATVLRETAEA